MSKLREFAITHDFSLVTLSGEGGTETFFFPEKDVREFGDFSFCHYLSEGLDLSSSCVIVDVDYAYFYAPEAFRNLLDKLECMVRERIRISTTERESQKILIFASSYVGKKIKESSFWSYATRSSLGKEYRIIISIENLISNSEVFAYLSPESKSEITEGFVRIGLKDPNLLNSIVDYIDHVSSKIEKLAGLEIRTDHALLKRMTMIVLRFIANAFQLICQLPRTPKVVCIPRNIAKLEYLLEQMNGYRISKDTLSLKGVKEPEIEYLLFLDLLERFELIRETKTDFMLKPRMIWWMETNEGIEKILLREAARKLLDGLPQIDPCMLIEIKKGFRNVFNELTQFKDSNEVGRILMAEWWYKVFSKLGTIFDAYPPLPEKTAEDQHIGELLRKIHDDGTKTDNCDLFLPFLIDNPIPATYTEAIRVFLVNNIPVEVAILDADQLDRYYNATLAIAGLIDVIRSQLRNEFEPSLSFIQLMNMQMEDWMRAQRDKVNRELMVFFDSKIKEKGGDLDEIEEIKEVVSKNLGLLLSELTSLPDITEWNESISKDVRKKILSEYRKELGGSLTKSSNFNSIVANDFLPFIIEQWRDRAKLFPFLTLYNNWEYGHISKILYNSFVFEKDREFLVRIERTRRLLIHLYKEFSYLGIQERTLRRLAVCEKVLRSMAGIRRLCRTSINQGWCRRSSELLKEVKSYIRSHYSDEEIIWKEFVYRECSKLERFFTIEILRNWHKADVLYLPQIGRIVDSVVSGQIKKIQNSEVRNVFMEREWDAVILIVVDSLSFEEFLSHFDYGKFDLVLPALAVLPSETFSGHTSVATGRFPQEHGIWGKTLIDKKTGKEVKTCGDIDFKPTLFHKDDSSIERLIFSRFAWEGLAEILCERGNYIQEPLLDDRFEQVLRYIRLANIQSKKSIIMLQVDVLDYLGHRVALPNSGARIDPRRVHSFVYRAFSEYVSTKFEWLLAKLREIGGKYVVIVTADHGKIFREDYKNLFKYYRVEKIKESAGSVLVHPRFALVYEGYLGKLNDAFLLKVDKLGRYNPKAIYVPPYLMKTARGAIHGGALLEEIIIPFAIKKL